jgi:hypothetical protein
MVPFIALFPQAVIALPKSNGRMFINQCCQKVNNLVIILNPGLVLMSGSGQVDCPTSLTLTQVVFLY